MDTSCEPCERWASLALSWKNFVHKGLPGGMKWPVGMDYWKPTGLEEDEIWPSRGLICAQQDDYTTSHINEDTSEKEREYYEQMSWRFP